SSRSAGVCGTGMGWAGGERCRKTVDERKCYHTGIFAPILKGVGQLAEKNIDSDVLVVGGGPRGSTTAALLARAGLRVPFVERDAHPRFHMGESSLPMNMPILDRLGLCERLHQIGVKKMGADFPADNERGYNVFRFERCLNPTWPHAYQVRREEFDQML